MIINRYLSLDILKTTFAVVIVLLLIILSARIIGYLNDAAAGQIQTSVILELVIYRTPKILELLLPLGLFLGILLAYGRFYLDSEMIVLKACGVGPFKLASYAIGPAVFIALLVALMTLYLTPTGMTEARKILSEQKERSELDMLLPGKFQVSKNERQVTYARQVSDEGELVDVFISGIDAKDERYILVARKGSQRFLDDQGRFLVFEEGYRYNFSENNSVEEIQYHEYGLKMRDVERQFSINAFDALPTLALLENDSAFYIGRLHWRLSLPFLAIIVVLLAVQLSKTSPRQGRYSKLIPAIIIYQVYVGALTAARAQVEQGDAGSWLIWFVHIAVLIIALSMFVFEGAIERFFERLPKFPRLKSFKRRAL
ncbi:MULTISPECIES: LPS export ABC transporter permease LptF [unclassified Marinobacterium]|uniref:LPS export ABC transporter permease LptF n=1 Tax=unclassified Marinobacterium TaxID=2644139 RepID=UPI0015690A0E|nr:Lipopolysaccharide export system permease protein LptF [Marinobacterium sp. xm-d-420]NRP56182.1 Lipopolysaccharide export system permease protein LptF [Marinobacterium sp. xm-d-510]NRP97029.1 Lipopolysaccharide export system permease protein LptF [Marinobacterium sp. xm-a-127]